MATKIIIEKDTDTLFRQAVAYFIEHLKSCLNPKVVVGLCGGRSVVGFLKALDERKNEISFTDWKRLEFFMVDERLVSLEDQDSNFKLVNDLFLHKAVKDRLLESSQVHPIFDPLADTDFVASSYTKELNQFGGTFSIVILGVGEDGHVAALFPEHPSINHQSKNFITFDDSPKPPKARLTASRQLLSKSKCGIALLLGASKQKALDNYRDTTLDEIQCPLKIIDRLPKAYLFSDLS